MSTKNIRRVYVTEYPIEFGGEKHKLRFDLGAFGALEDIGYDYVAIIEMATQIKFKNIAPLIWAGIHHEENEDLTIAEINKMISINEVSSLTPKIARAILNSLPEKEEGDEDQSKKQVPVEKK